MKTTTTLFSKPDLALIKFTSEKGVEKKSFFSNKYALFQENLNCFCCSLCSSLPLNKPELLALIKITRKLTYGIKGLVGRVRLLSPWWLIDCIFLGPKGRLWVCWWCLLGLDLDGCSVAHFRSAHAPYSLIASMAYYLPLSPLGSASCRFPPKLKARALYFTRIDYLRRWGPADAHSVVH